MRRARGRSRPVGEDAETLLSSWKGTVDMVNFSEVKALMHLDLTYNSFGGVIPDTNGSLLRQLLASGSIESWQVEWRATNGDISISTSGAGGLYTEDNWSAVAPPTSTENKYEDEEEEDD
eukprot:Gb_31204 [translate_table: standard]